MRKFLATLLIFSSVLLAQSESDKQIKNKFFEVDQNLDELRTELRELRKEVREAEIRNSAPVIRTEIKKMLQMPEMTHEILLANGTIVQGKIIYEDLDKLIVQTQIGQLTIPKNNIELTRKAKLPKAKCEVEGPINEKVYEGKRVYSGQIKNTGVRRADFPRIVFKLFDEAANLVATDSLVVGNDFHMYNSGVQTDATIDPGKVIEFECIVEFPAGSEISYYIKEVKWEEFE